MKKEIKAAVYGSTGFAGEELLKLLEKRKEVKIVYLPRRKEMEAGERIPSGIDVAFLALDPRISMAVAPKLLRLKTKVIDLSGAFRLRHKELFEKWYGIKHTGFGLTHRAIYGLPEKQRGLIKHADLIACPGCYPTAAILGMMPILSIYSLCLENKIIIEATSGYTGAGKGHIKKHGAPSRIEPYKSGREHQHIPEIEQGLGLKNQLFFYPKRAPWPRGIEMEIVFPCKIRKSMLKFFEKDLICLFQRFYKNDLFIKIVEEGVSKEAVLDTNYCYIFPAFEDDTIKVKVVIDNLLKGAAGQAMQNFNLMFGFKEEEGLL
jgi:N-acetyl-gamma-glutamyl-phosphate reductase